MFKRKLTLLALIAALSVGGAVFISTTAYAQESYRGPTRVDFDERLIRGQTTKAGSVYIFDRQEIEIRSLVVRTRRFTPATIRTVFEE